MARGLRQKLLKTLESLHQHMLSMSVANGFLGTISSRRLPSTINEVLPFFFLAIRVNEMLTANPEDAYKRKR